MTVMEAEAEIKMTMEVEIQMIMMEPPTRVEAMTMVLSPPQVGSSFARVLMVI